LIFRVRDPVFTLRSPFSRLLLLLLKDGQPWSFCADDIDVDVVLPRLLLLLLLPGGAEDDEDDDATTAVVDMAKKGNEVRLVDTTISCGAEN
jgi:hypothetical protein